MAEYKVTANNQTITGSSDATLSQAITILLMKML